MNSTLELAAEELGRRLHVGQKRNNGDDYITHPARIAGNVKSTAAYFLQPILNQYGTGLREYLVQILTAASWVHDGREDGPKNTGLTVTQIDNLIIDGLGQPVLDIVLDVSRKPDENYVAFIIRASKNPLARILKIFDLRDNMSDGKEGSRMDKYRFAHMYLMEAWEKDKAHAERAWYQPDVRVVLD